VQFDSCSHVICGAGVGVGVAVPTDEIYSPVPCCCCSWSVSTDCKLLSGLVLLPSFVPWLLFLLLSSLLLLLPLASEPRILLVLTCFYQILYDDELLIEMGRQRQKNSRALEVTGIINT
jgi:hypothetical protein